MNFLLKFLVFCLFVYQINARSLPVETKETAIEQSTELSNESNDGLKDIDIDDLIQYIQSLPAAKLKSLLKPINFDDSQENQMFKRSHHLNQDKLNDIEVDDLINYLMSLKSSELNSLIRPIDFSQFDIQND